MSGICALGRLHVGKAASGRLDDPGPVSLMLPLPLPAQTIKWASENCCLPPITNETRVLEKIWQEPGRGKNMCSEPRHQILTLSSRASCCSPLGLICVPGETVKQHSGFSAEVQRLSSNSQEKSMTQKAP